MAEIQWRCDRCGDILKSDNKKDFNCLTVDSWGYGRRGPIYLCEHCYGLFSAFMDGMDLGIVKDASFEEDFDYDYE